MSEVAVNVAIKRLRDQVEADPITRFDGEVIVSPADLISVLGAVARIAEACHHATHHPGDSFDEYLSGRSDMAYEVEAILNEGTETK